MIPAILVEGLIRAVMEVGLDLALDQKPQATIDLAPVTAALEELSRQNRDIFSAISRPTQTAGEEMCERAVTAFTKGWYDDALRDASKSIDLYPYSAKPRLVGGLAAVALSQGDKGLELLRSAVKYSANGQPEVGAVAAIMASHLALAVGGRNLAGSLLMEADQITGGRCPAVVGALWHHGGAASSSAEERLKQLWWDDHKPLTTGYSRSVVEGVLKSASVVESDYLTAGDLFRRYLDEVADVARSNLAAFDTIAVQWAAFVATRKVDINHGDSSVKDALRHAPIKLALGWLDSSAGTILAKCKSLPGAAKWPGDDAWKSSSVPHPSVVRELFVYTARACEQRQEDHLPWLWEGDRLLPMHVDSYDPAGAVGVENLDPYWVQGKAPEVVNHLESITRLVPVPLLLLTTAFQADSAAPSSTRPPRIRGPVRDQLIGARAASPIG